MPDSNEHFGFWAPTGTYDYTFCIATGFPSVNGIASGSTNCYGPFTVTLGGAGIPTPAAALQVTSYGAKCDGSTNDTTAVNNAFAAAVAVGTSLGSAEVAFPAGICIGNFTIVQGKGLRIHGTGQLSTRLRSPNGSPALQINGLWYSSFADMSFDTNAHSTGNAILEIDGSYDGTHHQGVQFLTFTNVGAFGQGLNDGLLSYIAIALCRQGGNSGCQGSNVKFDTVAMNGCTFSCYYQLGYNALANICIICDVQNYTTDGFRIDLGDMGILSSSGESIHGWTQNLNGGCDIRDNAAYYAMPIYDFRSESLMLACGTGTADIRGMNVPNNNGLCISTGQCSDGSVNWAATTAFGLGAVTFQTPQIYSASNPTLGIEGNNQLGTYYVVTTAGTSGGSAPQWTYTGTVTDGSVVWTQTRIPRINLIKASFDSTGQGGYTTGASGANVSQRPHYRTISPNRTTEYVTYNTLIDADDEYLLVDASSQNISITIGGGLLNAISCSASNLLDRKPLYIRRIDPVNTTTGARNTVTINPVIVQGNYATRSYGDSITLPPDGYVELTCSAMDSGQYAWVVTGGTYQTFGNTSAYSNTASAGAVTLNAKSGFITSESLSTAAGSDYVLTFSNNRILPNTVPHFIVMNGTNTGGMPTIATVNNTTSGQAIVDVHNSGSSAFNGTLILKFLVF